MSAGLDRGSIAYRFNEIPLAEQVTDDETARARRAVAARAEDPADARLLLEALGLTGGAS